MRYEEFRAKVENYPIFGDWIFDLICPGSTGFKNSITDWIEKGYVIRLKKGVYVLREKDRRQKISRSYMANHLYSPSYISLEYALQYYGFIPERVYSITSVSSKKTSEFSNQEGNFSYKHVKTEVFSDFVSIKDSYGNNFFIATPEKALLDFLYLKVRYVKNIEADIFDVSYRMQHLENIDCDKLRAISKKFKQKKMSWLTDMLIDYIEQEWK